MKERSNLQTLVNKHSLELSSLVATPPTGDSVKTAEGGSVKVVEKKQKVYSIELGEAGGGGAAVRTLVNTEVKTEQERSEVKQESGEVREAVGSVLSELSSRCRLIMTFRCNLVTRVLIFSIFKGLAATCQMSHGLSLFVTSVQNQIMRLVSRTDC